MNWIKVGITLCAVALGVWADVGPGQNSYLPPDKGYRYDKPTITFPTPTRQPTRPPTRPPQPPPIRPSTRPPPYIPPPPPVVPTRPPPVVTSYVPPSPPRTTRPPYIPPGTTRPPYIPPGTTRPPYIPPGTTRPPVTSRPYTPPTRPPTDLDGYPSDGHHEHEHHEHHEHHEPGMPFDFTYAVNDVEHGNDYSHNAVSDGDVTRGEYRVQLPDGRLQVVKYTADWKHGFHAQVSYEGQPTYPNYQGANTNQQGYKY